MLFSWANKQLEKLAETVAPVCSDEPHHRFLSCLNSGDEQTALSLLSDHPPLDPNHILNPARGTRPIHAASRASAASVVRSLIDHHGISPDCLDLAGNGALHHAASSDARNATDVVKFLVERGAGVTLKNSEGRTPYDVSSNATVRQYLLPLQLQRETQACLDSGGEGLPMGIDLGGNRVANAPALAPPPIFPTSGAPVSSAASGAYPPPAFPASVAPISSGAYPPTAFAAMPPPPLSGARRIIKADGFHSSASDVDLQQKYGHVKQAPSSELPPPPSFAMPGRGGQMPAGKYLAYDAVADRAHLPETRAAPAHAPPPVNFNVFNPGAANGR